MSLGRNYRKLWAATAISNIGDGVVITAFPLLATQLTRDPVLISTVAVLERLPWALFTLVSGALADRLDKRRLMSSVDTFRGVLIGVVAAGVHWHWMSLPLLYVSVLLLGTAETLFDNASQAMMPAIVSRDQLRTANSRLYAVNIVMNEFVGPPVGSFLFAAAAAVPFAIDGVSFVAAAAIVATMSGSFRANAAPTISDAAASEVAVPEEGVPLTGAARPTLRADIAEGVRWLWRNKLLRTMAFSLGLFNLIGNGSGAILVLFALDKLHLRESAFGLLMASAAVGSLLGSFFAERVARKLGGGPALVAIGLVSGVTMTLTGLSSNAYVVGALFAIGAFGGIVWNVITVSLRQSVIPEHLMGRVNSVYRMIGWGSIPIGAAIGGFVGKAFGIRAPFVGGGIALVTITLVVFVRMVPGIRAIEAAESS